MRPVYALSLIFTAMLLGVVFSGQQSYSQASISAMLKEYGVPAYVASNLTYENITYNGNSYVGLYEGSTPYFLINITRPSYSFVTNESEIMSIISSYSANSTLSRIDFSVLSSDMTTYLDSTGSLLKDCIQLTGLDTYTCTPANNCLSCLSNPTCWAAFEGAGGFGSVVGQGMLELQANYTYLLSNESIFYNSVNEINASNFAGRMQDVQSAYNNIAQITGTIANNPLFIPPSGTSYGSCPFSQIKYNQNNWQCSDVGICLPLNYNTGDLNNVQVDITNIDSRLPTQEYFKALAQQTFNVENTYIVPTVDKQQRAKLGVLLNTTLAGYNTTVKNSISLLSHIYNASLSSSLIKTENSYSTLLSDYLTLNLTNYSVQISSEMGNLTRAYDAVNATYSSLVAKSGNNTALLLGLQLNSGPGSQASDVAFQQAQLDEGISGRISNTSYMGSRLSAVNSEALSLKPVAQSISPEEIARSIDGPFSVLLGTAAGLPYPQSVSLVPVDAAALSLLIGLIIIGAVYSMHKSMKKKRRIVLNRRTSKNWAILFAILAILVLAYTGATYVFALQANESAPLSVVQSVISSSGSIAVGINGTADSATAQCASSIAATAKSIGKNVTRFSINQGVCTVNGNHESVSQCLNFFVSAHVPVVLLTPQNSSSIRLYSMYGTTLYASGSDSFMNSCYPKLFIR